MVSEIVDIVGKGNIDYVPWPIDYEQIETGDTIPSIAKIQRICKFNPIYTLRQGLERTYEYYHQYFEYYNK